MNLQALPPSAHARISSISDLLDEAITEIRTSVFALRSAEQGGPSARHRLLDVVSEAAGLFATPPRVVFEGTVDELAPPELILDLEAVIREGLSNSARHANATSVSVVVRAEKEEISVRILDNGAGLGTVKRASGTMNLEARAVGWGGSSRLVDGEDGGALLEWTVPTPRSQEISA
jgi:signal transduction histidine kinase